MRKGIRYEYCYYHYGCHYGRGAGRCCGLHDSFGVQALLAEWAIEAITKAEKEFVGTKLGEARLAVVVSWLRAKVPAPLRFLVTDSMIQKVVQMTFNAAKAGLEVLKDA